MTHLTWETLISTVNVDLIRYYFYFYWMNVFPAQHFFSKSMQFMRSLHFLDDNLTVNLVIERHITSEVQSVAPLRFKILINLEIQDVNQFSVI